MIMKMKPEEAANKIAGTFADNANISWEDAKMLAKIAERIIKEMLDDK